MKPLLSVVAALLILRLDPLIAAPQPLSLLNSTDIDDEGTATTNVSKADDDTTKLSNSESVNDETSTATLSSSLPVNEKTADVLLGTESAHSESNSTEIRSDSNLNTEKVLEETANNQDDAKLTTRANEGADILTTRSESVNTEINNFSDYAKQPEESTEEILSKDDIPEEVTISRYVPPLDPMKHMLMMAEVRKQLELSSTTETPEISSTALPVTSEHLKVDNENNAEEIEKGPSEFEKLSIASTISETFNSSEDPLSIKYSDELISSEADKSDESSETSTERPTTIPNNVPKVTEINSLVDFSDDTHGISHENVSLILGSELFSGRNESLIIGTSTEIDESKERDSTEQTQPTTFTEPSTTITTSESHSTDALHSSTDIKSEESIEEISLVRSDEEPLSVKISESEEITTMQPIESTSPNNKELGSSASTEIPSSSVVYSDSIITTTFKPELTTNEVLENLSASKDETSKNVTLEEELKFKEENVFFNASNVAYHDETTDSALKLAEGNDDYSSTENFSSENKAETTTLGFFTTLRDIVFGSSTVTPEIEAENPNVESFDTNSTVLEKVKPSENFTYSDTGDLAEVRSESDLPVENPSSDLTKIELIKEGVDSISTDSPHSLSSTISDNEPTTDQSNEDSSNYTITTEEESLFETVKEDSTSTEKEEFVSSNEELEATTVSKIVTAENAPEKSELLKSSDPESITEVSNETTTENNPKTDEELLVKSSTRDRYVSGNNTDSVAAVQFLHYHDKASSEQCFKLVDAHWKYATNLTDENKKKQLEQTLEYSLFHKDAWKNATSFAWKSFNDTHLRRWFKSLSVLGTAALPEDKLNEFNRLKAEMKNTYSTAKICPYVSPESKENSSVITSKDCKLTLEPDVQRILTKSRNYEELTHVWKAWRDAAGKPIREKYLRFVNLSNEAARLNGFPDTGDMWREAYESDTFEEDLEMLWEQLRPLYEHLHAYVRRKLIHVYGNENIKDDGPIPAHLFGNMWAQSWVSLLDITQPFSGKPSVDVTPIMEAKNLTAFEMFQISEEFFTSLGLKPMPKEFWKHSLIEKPKDREIICHASAWDFCNGKDYRIKQCTDITMEDLITVHHEMGHIQYFLQYARQPNVFREGANPGFHEAIGDVLALSVSTPKHLQSIGLLEEIADDPEGDLNFLLRTALDKVSFLPSGYLIDLWRWGLFSGEIKPEEMNTKWWDLRLKYQGICPPVKRYDTDFDPGAKYHVPGNVPYIRYFVSFVIQFQFHKVLCDAAGHTGPLYKCDIYRSKEAGQILSQVMELGSSEHWSEAMKIMTGGATNKMDAGPILEYFHPLMEFLEQQNQNETLGWRSNDSTICP